MDKVKFVSKFGVRIRQVREDMQLSQTEMGRLLGATKQTISKWELGLRTPNAGRILEIATKLEVDPGWLIGADFER